VSKRHAFVIALGVLGGAAVSGAGCSPDSLEPLTWEQFQAQAHLEADTGLYVVNGDELAGNLLELRAAYDRYLASIGDAADREAGLGRAEEGLIINTVNGQWDRWSPAQALNITYCISQSSFGARYSAVVQAMNSATGAWESAAHVNFVHSSGNDGNCTRNTGVVFNVRQVCSGQYLARAFFPSTSRSGREILIDCTSFGNIKPWSLAGVLRHELGHTIGFRHEHTRPEAGTCFEDNKWAALTSYDSSSVMHYPQCNGTNNGDLNLTNKDKQGAGIAYP
jgi:hypothetical protein